MIHSLATVSALLIGFADTRAQETLPQARADFETKLVRQERETEPLLTPPAELFSLVEFETSLGSMSAYLGRSPRPGKHPAIIWITGGFPPGGTGTSAWEMPDPEDDQSAQAYRRAGVVMMYPTLRGSFGNPGHQESFFGEVDDVLAALDHLRGIDYVDPNRIYLGGHSTGGTLALLVAAATDRFKAVFSFGPVSDPANYGEDSLTYDPSDSRESRLRAPIEFLDAIRTPTFVIEGEDGNINDLNAMRKQNENPRVTFHSIGQMDHFDVLAPMNRYLANAIAKLDAKSELTFDNAAIEQVLEDMAEDNRRARDLHTLAAARKAGIDLGTMQTTRHYVLNRVREPLDRAGNEAARSGFQAADIRIQRDSDGDPYFVLVLRKRLKPSNHKALFRVTESVNELCTRHDLYYRDWDIE